MLLYLLLASLRGALPVTGAATRKAGEETPGQLRSKADEALLKKDTDTALSLLARAIKLEPDNERNYFKRANVLKRAGKASRAVEDLDSALRIKPGYGAALLMRARALLGIGRCAEAKRDYDAAKDKDGSGAAAGCVAALRAADKARAKGDRRLELEHLAEVLEKYASDQPSPFVVVASAGALRPQGLVRVHRRERQGVEANAGRPRSFRIKRFGLLLPGGPRHGEDALAAGAAERPGAPRVQERLQEAAVAHEEGRGRRQACRDRRPREGRRAVGVGFKCGRGPRRLPRVYKFKDCRVLPGAEGLCFAKRHCDAVLSQDDKNVDALIKRTEAEIGAEDYESARRTAARAREVSDDDRTRKNQQKAEVALKQSKEVNHYKVLGVPRDARTRDIKKAYRDAALKYHPDKIAPDVSDSERERLTAKFQEIAAAYEILSDEETRAKYDAGEDVSGSGQQSQGFPGGFPGFPGGFPGGGFQQGGQRFFTFR